MSQTAKPSSEMQAAQARARATVPPPATGGSGGGQGGMGDGAGPVGSVTDVSPGDFAAALQAFLKALLERQCRLTGAVAGVIYLAGSGSRQPSIGATYSLPGGGSGDAGGRIGTGGRITLDQAMVTRLTRYATEASVPPSGQAKAELLTLAAADPRSGAGMYQPDPTHRVLACPLVAADEVHGASVLVVPLAVRMDSAEALERVALTGASYEAFLWRNHALGEAHTKTRLRETLELLDAAQQGEDAEAMGAIFCHELQRRFGCTRAAIGLIRGNRVRVVGVSGTDELNKRSAVAESLEAVMEECAEQDIEVVYPMPAEDEGDPSRRRVTRAHELHSTRQGPAAILSLPLRVSGDLVGVVTLEREPTNPFPSGAVPLLRLVAEFIGPALWTRRMADRGVAAVVRDRTAEIAALTFGPRYTGVKALIALVVVTLLLMGLVPIPGRVTAECETRAATSRTISPPYEGFLEHIHVKPGDRVEAGTILATMDIKETELSLEKARYRLQKLKTQGDELRRRAQHGEAAVLAAETEEVQFEINLYADRIERGKIISPLTGVVSRGDIEPLVGAKVEPSQPLFEVIASDKQIVVLQVKERDVGNVTVGQEGRLAVTALPDTKIPIRVARIRPAGEAVQKQNVFFVEAEILEDQLEGMDKPLREWLHPGMTGTARLDNGTTTVLWELVKPVVDAARLRLWW